METSVDRLLEQEESIDSKLQTVCSEPKSPQEVSDSSEKISSNNLSSNEDSEDDAPRNRGKRHIQKLSDSDSEREQNSNEKTDEIEEKLASSGSDSDSSNLIKSVPHLKSRIQLNNDSDSDDSNIAIKNEEQQLRLKNKKDKLKNKFTTLLSSRNKGLSLEGKSDSNDSVKDMSNESGDDEISAIEELKQKIKDRMASFKSSVCDPDTSDEETQQQKMVYKQKKQRKSIKSTSPKPQRMSAKQAMENMQKIKSESNRMLREKEVSLPYHRPKALSLKDIMSRRQPALSSDGKTLPIKMNDKQLQQYAQMLEERQKKMMELWQSESDEEENGVNESKITAEDKSIENPREEIITNEVSEPLYDNHKLLQSHGVEINSSLNQYQNTCEKNIETANVHAEIDNTSNDNKTNSPSEPTDDSTDNVLEEQSSETNISLKYNDSETSITEDKTNNSTEVPDTTITKDQDQKTTEELSKSKQLELEIGDGINTEDMETEDIHLHFNTEKNTNEFDSVEKSDNHDKEDDDVENKQKDDVNKSDDKEAMDTDKFSDDELNMDDIDNMIENAEIMKNIEDKVNSPLLLRDISLNAKPKLTGAPGTFIDLDGTNPLIPKKSGIELLKERFTFFAKLKTPEEMEREKEKKLKPGTQHLKLKQELEEKIAEQRSLEWSKRLEEEKQQQNELKVLRGEESEDEDDIDKIEAKLEESETQGKENEGNSEDENLEEEELIEDDCDMNDKPRSKNAMLDEEAEVSDCGDYDKDGEENDPENEDAGDEDDESDDESESSESEEEEQPTAKKGRILKAFEDSDDEEDNKTNEQDEKVDNKAQSLEPDVSQATQDDELQLAQKQSASEDFFATSQESSLNPSQTNEKVEKVCEMSQSGADIDLGTQTFSILESSKQTELEACEGDTQTGKTSYLDVGVPGAFTQDILPLPATQANESQSQPIGDDVLALCTGKFYDSEFVSQSELNRQPTQDDDNFICDSFISDEKTQEMDTEKCFDKTLPAEEDCNKSNIDMPTESVKTNEVQSSENQIETSKITSNSIVDSNLKAILDELGDPEFDSPPKKYFVSKKDNIPESQVKKKMIIESDDEDNDESTQKKKKKLKKKKLEQRALQFSDEEEEEITEEDEDVYESEIENEEPDRLVEYDSEENEIEVIPNKPKKKKKIAEFFEQEAELTSEDEWVGSGDENEAGLDQMEREAGDDEVFHQGKLQRELGQILMRDVLDQDKREVRMIQELLFEDGDLGGGGRQRKFRWKNLDGEEDTGVLADDFVESQEDQESEEQWRKQRHEREMFLRQMQNKEDETLNISVNRSSIIKANLASKSMSSLLLKVTNTEKAESPIVPDKKTVKDIPSPKKPFALQQQSYQGSFLQRGRGALARLAALATPLVASDESRPTTSRRNFVFAALSQDEPKVTIKRKAESNIGTPKLIKKMKTEEKRNTSKSSLLDHINL